MKHLKKVIFVLVMVISLVGSSMYMGTSALAEDGTEGEVYSDERDGDENSSGDLTPSEEVTPSLEEEQESGLTSEPAFYNGAIAPQATVVDPVRLTYYSDPSSVDEDNLAVVEIGEKLEYRVKVENTANKDLSDVVVKIAIDEALKADMDSIKYYKKADFSDATAISGSSNYSTEKEGNNVIIKINSLADSDYIRFIVTCDTTEQVGRKISSKANLYSCDGETYSGIESVTQWHKLYYETSIFTLKNNISSSEYIDGDKIFTYTFDLKRNNKGLNSSLPYELISGNTTAETGTMEVVNGIARVSFKSKYTLKIKEMPTNTTYVVTPQTDSSYTLNKSNETGTTTNTAQTNLVFTSTYKYVPVKYSLDTSIVTKMQGRDFQSGDRFIYSIYPEDDSTTPLFNRFPINRGIAGVDEYEDGLDIAPTSSNSFTHSLAAQNKTWSCHHCFTCGKYFRNAKEYNFMEDNVGCMGNYELANHTTNVAPEIMFLYPGTYNYIIFQTAMEADDFDSIWQDTTQYKVTVQVTDSGSTLTPKLTTVRKSTDDGATWTAVTDKAKLTFTNVYGTDSVMKGDVNQNKRIDMGDVIMCLNHVSKKGEPLTGKVLGAADVDGDGKVSQSDVIKILNYVSKKTPTL